MNRDQKKCVLREFCIKNSTHQSPNWKDWEHQEASGMKTGFLYNTSLYNYSLKASSLSHLLGLYGIILTILLPWSSGNSSPWGIFSCQTNSFSCSNFLSISETSSISFLNTDFHDSSPGIFFVMLLSARRRTPTATPTWLAIFRPSAKNFWLLNSCRALQENINSCTDQKENQWPSINHIVKSLLYILLSSTNGERSHVLCACVCIRFSKTFWVQN